jgi:elongation factor P
MKANDIRKGMVILYNGVPHKVMEFHHVTPGKGRAKMQTKLRNLLAGTQTEVSFASTESVELADVFTAAATYLYSDTAGYHFMNSDSYEQVTFDEETLGDAQLYLQDGMEVQITLFEGQPIGIQLPTSVVLTIVETEPSIKGATATNSPKPAKTETGLTVSVPPFVSEGEKIVVNTTDGSYVSRAES